MLLINPFVLGAGGGGAVDPPFAAVQLLINAETAGATSSDFIDVSTAGRTITRNSSATVRDAAAAVFGSFGIEADVSGGRSDFTVGSAADWTFLHDGTDKWTLDIQADFADFSVTRVLLDTAGGTTANSGIYVQVDTSRVVLVQIYRGDSVNTVINGSFTALNNHTNPRHLRLTCNLALGSANMALFEDGNGRGTLNKSAHAPSAGSPAYPLRFFGYGPSGGDPMRGGFDEIRIAKGYTLDGSEVQAAPWPTS
jgi:hypothetical protein